jgi:hypothetical protein
MNQIQRLPQKTQLRLRLPRKRLRLQLQQKSQRPLRHPLQRLKKFLSRQ